MRRNHLSGAKRRAGSYRPTHSQTGRREPTLPGFSGFPGVPLAPPVPLCERTGRASGTPTYAVPQNWLKHRRGSGRGVFAIVTLLLLATVAGAQEEYTEPPLAESDREHWAFQPIVNTKVPPASFDGWEQNPIDHFIARKLKAAGLRPQPRADQRTLLRRLKFGVLGLPPTPDEVAAAEATSAEKLITGFLSRPGYGERWGQHWLDLARFAETDGFEHDKTRANAWKYRDWVISALNRDMPYDQFLLHQLAGDEVAPEDADARVATMFCLSGPDMPDINLIEERKHSLLNEMTSTVSEVFLGLQLGCAQCHDHKYDPISQADFYRMRAIFEPAVQLKHNKSVGSLAEKFPFKSASHVMFRGDFRRHGPEVHGGTPRVLNSETLRFKPVAGTKTAGQRTALAQWMTHPKNPLTARVIVNRVWLHHFGKGLAPMPSDFGLIGDEPSHPELLDWLARWFIESGWSLKKLHTLVLSSGTWQQRSMLPADGTVAERSAWKRTKQADPDNDLYSRFTRRRLEGEAIRDAMLAASGSLNRKRGGPGIRPPLPKALTSTLLRNQWKVTADKQEHDRRSIYVFARRNLRYPIFEAFDRPDANASCSARLVSTTAPQSLHLLNSDFSLAMAKRLADVIVNEKLTPRSQVTEAFQRALGRQPSSDELRAAAEFLGANQSLAQLCLGLFNSNEFVFVD